MDDPAAGLGPGRCEPVPRRGILRRRRGRHRSLCDAAAVAGFLSPGREGLWSDASGRRADEAEEGAGEGGGGDAARAAGAASAAGAALGILSRVCGARRGARPPASQDGSTFRFQRYLIHRRPRRR